MASISLMQTLLLHSTPCFLNPLRVLSIAMMVVLATGIALVPAVAASPDEKTHTLFMGLDLSLEHEKTFHRVRDVSGDSFVITAKSAPVFLPVNRASHNLRVASVLKLTSVSATIASLSSERVYSPRNDPRMQRLKEMNRSSAALGDAQSLAIDKAAAATQAITPIYAGSGDSSGSGARAQEAAAQRNAQLADEAFASAEQLSIRADPAMASADLYAGRIADDLSAELFDAIEVNFELSSEMPLNNPYFLLVARFREPKAAQSTARNWIYAKSLDPIGSKPVKVHVMKAGFPPGYLLEEFKVHLYNRGDEVATNVSTKRVPLTRDEAFEYVKIQYLSSHKAATLPATPVMGKLPADLNVRLTGGQLNQTYFVKVSKDGNAGEAFLDESCSQKVEDLYLESVLKSIRFKPALEKGKPVDDVARLKLDDLPL